MHQALQYLLPGKRHRWLLICVASIGLSLFLQWDGQVLVIGGNHDSLKYLAMAETLLNGNWLGEYDQMTLIRLPIYSTFLALNGKMEWPLQRAQVLLYLASIGFLMAALRSVNVNRWRIAAACVLCSFHPAGILAPMYLATESLYTSVATIVLAGCIGVMGSVKKNNAVRFFWVILLSGSLALFWHIRSESQWILPLGIGYVSYVLWEFRYGYRKNWVILSFTMLLPCFCVYSLTVFLQNENKKYYGMGVTNELNEPNFAAVFHWLSRVDVGYHHPYIPVTQAALNQAYGISPHFSMLKPFLSQQTEGRGWAKFGCEWMGICDELAGGWTLWAVRDAAASIGVYQSAISASHFYGEVAREVQTACKNGSVQCVENPTGNMLAPPLMWADLPRIFRSCIKMVVLSITFGKLLEAVQDAPPIQPSTELVSRYDQITHDQSPLKRNLSTVFIGIAIQIFQAIQIAGGIWLLIAVGIKSWKWIKNIQSGLINIMPEKYALTGCLMVFILSRIAVVAYIDAMSFYAQLRYMIVIYPALITLICLLPVASKNADSF